MTPTLFYLELRAGRAGAVRRLKLALRAESGNVVRTAKRLGVSVRTFQDWRGKVPFINEAIEAARTK